VPILKTDTERKSMGERDRACKRGEEMMMIFDLDFRSALLAKQ